MGRILILAGYADSLTGFRAPLIREIVARGHEVIACAPEESQSVQSQLEAWGVEYRSAPLQRTGLGIRSDLEYLQHLYFLMRAVQPDAVFPYTAKPVIYASLAARFAGVPVTVSMITGLGYAFSGETFKRRLLTRLVQGLYRQALRSNQAVFFQNPDDLNLFRDLRIVGSSNDPTLINGSGVGIEEFKPELYPDKVSFLLIARLIQEKGVREYAAAARILKERYPEARFRLVGWIDSGPQAIRADELETWQKDGVLEYLGKLEDVRPAIADTSVFVLPSYYREGTPRTILEALSMARPVITADSPGCRETVVNGRNGYLVPPKEVEALAEAMEVFLKDPSQVPTMGQSSRQLAEEKYDVRKVNNVILEKLESALNRLDRGGNVELSSEKNL